MTTIAYRDGALAADSLSTANGLRDGMGVKVWRVGEALVSACGSRSLCLKFRAWVAGGMEGQSPFEGTEEGNGIVATPARVICFGQHGSWPVDAPFYSLGSGYQIAIGAMEMGATAEQAVSCAIKHDIGSGGEITVLKHA